MLIGCKYRNNIYVKLLLQFNILSKNKNYLLCESAVVYRTIMFTNTNVLNTTTVYIDTYIDKFVIKMSESFYFPL